MNDGVMAVVFVFEEDWLLVCVYATLSGICVEEKIFYRDL